MKKLILIIFLININFSYCQVYTIIDSLTKSPIPYVAVKTINSDSIHYSNEFGQFYKHSKIGETLQFSCLGYKNIKHKISSLNDTIILTSEPVILKTIYLNSKKYKIKKISSDKRAIRWSINENYQLGILIKSNNLYNKSSIRQVTIPLKKLKSENNKYVFNIQFFSNENNRPGHSLIDRPINITINTSNNEDLVIDIEDEQINFSKEGIFVCIETVGYLDSNGNIVNKTNSNLGFVFTNRSSEKFYSELFYKTKFSDNWGNNIKKQFHLEDDVYLSFDMTLTVYEN